MSEDVPADVLSQVRRDILRDFYTVVLGVTVNPHGPYTIIATRQAKDETSAIESLYTTPLFVGLIYAEVKLLLQYGFIQPSWSTLAAQLLKSADSLSQHTSADIGLVFVKEFASQPGYNSAITELLTFAKCSPTFRLYCFRIAETLPAA